MASRKRGKTSERTGSWCYACQTTEESRFSPSAWASKTGKLCRACSIAYNRNRYTPEQKRKMQKDGRAKKMAFVRQSKSERGCETCGEKHPACLDLHHRNPAEKRFNVSHAAQRNWTLSRIEAEMEKCAVICSNCHRKLHWEELGKAVERPAMDLSQLPRGRKHRSDSGRQKSGPMVHDIFPASK